MNPALQLEAYVGVVWEPDYLVEVRPLPAGLGKRRWIRAASLPGLVDELTEENCRGANLYVGVLPRTGDGKGTDGDCLPGRVVWADFDHVDPFQAGKVAAEKGMPFPSLVINSGHGAHLYWRLSGPESPEDISKFVGDLAVYLGSDTTVKNPSRILRLPGFVNHKSPAASAEYVHSKSAEYSLKLLRAILPPPTVLTLPVPLPGPQTGVLGHPGSPERDSLLERARRYVATVPGAVEGRRNGETFRVACLMVNDFSLSISDAAGIVSGWNQAANSPPLDEKELAEIMANAAKYSKKAAGSKATATLRRPPSRNEIKNTVGKVSDLRDEFKREARGERKSVSLPWEALQENSALLRPGTVAILGGPAGFGKSFLALELLAHVHRIGVQWSLLPLEDRRVDVQRRLLAHLERDWSVIDDSSETAPARMEFLERHESKLDEMAKHVTENPRLPVEDGSGKKVVPNLPYPEVLKWIENNPARVIVIDPLAQIEFGEKSWTGEKNFMRRLMGVATELESTIILVAHTVKRSGAAGKVALTGEDLQGAAEIKRLAHVVLILESHDYMNNKIWDIGGGKYDVSHNRTVLIDKARNAKGMGKRIAFNMVDAHFDELGVIAPADKSPRKQKEESGWTGY